MDEQQVFSENEINQKIKNGEISYSKMPAIVSQILNNGNLSKNTRHICFDVSTLSFTKQIVEMRANY